MAGGRRGFLRTSPAFVRRLQGDFDARLFSTHHTTAMAESSSSNNFIFDSLPYYDNDLEQFPILKEKVDKELAKEGEAPKELHPNVPPEVELFAVC
jgi:hypothetical protein